MSNATFSITLPEKLTEIRTSKDSPTGKLRAIMKATNAAANTWLDQPEDVFVQAVMQSGWLTTIGADIPEDATDADIAVMMRASSGLHKTDAWLRGDVALWVRNHKFNGAIPGAEAEKLAEMFGCSSKRVLNSATTSAAFPKESRHSEASFSLYELAAKVEGVEARNHLIEMAIQEKWTVRTMNEKVTEWINTGSSIDEEGNVTSDTDVIVDGQTVVKSNVSVSATSGLAVNVDACIAEIVDAMIDRGMAQKDATKIASVVLKFYTDAGLIKFPPRAWADGGSSDNSFVDEKTSKKPGKKSGRKSESKFNQELPTNTVSDDELPF